MAFIDIALTEHIINMGKGNFLGFGRKEDP